MDLREPAGMIPDRVFLVPKGSGAEDSRDIPASLFLETPQDSMGVPIGFEVHGYRVEGLIGFGGFAAV